MSSCPPIRRNRVGPPSSITVEKIAPSASASRKAWKTSALARSDFPAPTARATADETPAPIPLLVDCRTSITQGNTSEAPAGAVVGLPCEVIVVMTPSISCSKVHHYERVRDRRPTLHWAGDVRTPSAAGLEAIYRDRQTD